MTSQLNVDVDVQVEGQPGLDAAAGSFDRAADSAGRFGSIGQGVLQGVGQAVTNFGIGLAKAGLDAAFDAIGNSIDLASDKAEAASKAQVLFGDSYALVAERATNAATEVGLSSGKYLALAGDVGNLVTNFGFAGDAAATMSTEIVQLAADVGSFNNAPTADVVQAIGAAFRGESEPIRRFGVMLSDAAIKAKAVELGLYSGKGALEASAKATATYQLILEQTTNAQGDFARTSDGLANSQRIANARIEESLTKLGDVLMPIVQALVPLFADALTGAIDLATKAFTAIWDVVRPFVDVLVQLWHVIEGPLNTAIDVLGDVLDALLGPIKLAVDAIGGLVDLVGDAIGFVGDLAGGLLAGRGAFDAWAKAAGLAGEDVEEAWADVVAAQEAGVQLTEQDAQALIAAYGESADAVNAWRDQHGLAQQVMIENQGRMAQLADETADQVAASYVRQAEAAQASHDAQVAAARAAAEETRVRLEEVARTREEFIATWRAVGERVPGEIGAGMQEKANLVLDAARDLQDLLKNGLSPEQRALELIGQKYINLVRRGMDSEVDGAKETARDVAIQAINTIEDAGLTGAKGQRGLEAIGAYYDQLLAGGMTASEARVALAAAGVADTTIQALQSRASGGAAAAQAYVDRFAAGLRQGRDEIQDALSTWRGMLHGQSPPPKGPLSTLDDDGRNAAQAFLAPFLATFRRANLAGALARVMPGAQGGQLQLTPAFAGAGSSGSSPIVVNVYAGVGDPVEIGRQVSEALRQYQRASGTEA